MPTASLLTYTALSFLFSFPLSWICCRQYCLSFPVDFLIRVLLENTPVLRSNEKSFCLIFVCCLWLCKPAGSMLLYVHRDRIRDGVTCTSTSHFHAASELCSSVLLYVHRDPTDYLGRGAQDVHLDFHTAPEL